MSKLINVMIDIETAGTEVGSPILQIGATVFGVPTDHPNFSARFLGGASLESNEDHGLHAQVETLEWWSKQDPELKAKVFGSQVPITQLLEEFYLWCKSLGAPVVVWGNGATFDIVLLEEAFAATKVPVPWNFRNVRCYRTLTNILPLPADELATVAPNTQKHDALADAVYQADVAEKIASYWGVQL